MKRTVLLLSTLLLPLGALATQGGDTKAIFQARYDALTRAYLTKDLKAAGDVLAPDYIGGNFDVQMNRAKTLDALKHSDGSFQIKARKVLLATTNGNKASVMVESLTVGKRKDPKKPSIVHQYTIKLTAMDTWVKNALGWQLKRMHVIRSKITRDGKPYIGTSIG